MVAGRLINDRDMAAKAKVVILPQTYAKQLFPPDGNALGKRVGISGLSWKVVGIYDAPWNRNIYIPFTTVKMIHGNTDDLSDMSIMLKNLETERMGRRQRKAYVQLSPGAMTSTPKMKAQYGHGTNSHKD